MAKTKGCDWNVMPTCIGISPWSNEGVKHYAHWMVGTHDGVRLKELLATHSAFRREPHMESHALKLLEWIAERTISAGKGQSDWGVPTKKFQNAFRRGQQRHTAFKKALVDLGLIKMTKQYVAPGPVTQGSVARYSINETFRTAYLGAAENWTPPPEDRSKLVRKRTRRIREAQRVVDAFSKSHELLSCDVEMNWGAAPAGNERTAIAQAIMGKLKRVEFDRIRNDGKSSRLFHPLANFPSELRKHLRTKDKVYAGEVDVRACWPTYLATQLVWDCPDANQYFMEEYAEWTHLFCDEKKDPRAVILRQTNLPIRLPEMKALLNKYLNGALQAALENHHVASRSYVALDYWFSRRFPFLHYAWKKEGPSTLAYDIGLNFETPLMTAPELYDFAEKNGISLYYQYDGFGVFAHPGKLDNLKNILADLCRLMTNISDEKFAVPIVVRSKLIN